jgi:hypothetical protein
MHEPQGFVQFSDEPWDVLTRPHGPMLERVVRASERLRAFLFHQPERRNGWNYLRRTSAKDASIVTDATAPRSPANVLQIVYTAGCCIDAEPSVHWIGLPTVREIYTAWWIKLSPNWIPNPAGGGKITFLWTDGGNGQVYTNFYHPSADGSVQGPPYRIGANTEWAPYGQQIWYPNVTTTWINPGEWHRIEFYYRWPPAGAAGNGIIRWWVDGVLNGDYTTVIYPNALGFIQFEYAPTVQYAGPAERYMYIDHTYISIPVIR